MQYGTSALNTPPPPGANINIPSALDPDHDPSADSRSFMKKELDSWRYVLKRKVRTWEKRREVKKVSGDDLDLYFENQKQEISSEFDADDEENMQVAMDALQDIYLDKIHELAKNGEELTIPQIKTLLEDYNQNARESVLEKGLLNSQGFANWKDVAYKTGSTEEEVGLTPEHKNWFQNLPDDVKDLVRGGGFTAAAMISATLVSGGVAAIPILGAGIGSTLLKLGAKKVYREQKVENTSLGKEARDELLSARDHANLHANLLTPGLETDQVSVQEANHHVRSIMVSLHGSTLERVEELKNVNLRATILEGIAGFTGGTAGGLAGSLLDAHFAMNSALENGFAMKDGKVIGLNPGEQMNEMRRTAAGVWESVGHMVEKGTDGLLHPVMEKNDLVAAHLNGWQNSLSHFSSQGKELLQYSLPNPAEVGGQLFNMALDKSLNTVMKYLTFVHSAYEGLDMARKQLGGVMDNLSKEKIRAQLQQMTAAVPLGPAVAGPAPMPSTPPMPNASLPPQAPPSSVLHSGPSVPNSPSASFSTPSVPVQPPSPRPSLNLTAPDIDDISIPIAPQPVSPMPQMDPDSVPVTPSSEPDIDLSWLTSSSDNDPDFDVPSFLSRPSPSATNSTPDNYGTSVLPDTSPGDSADSVPADNDPVKDEQDEQSLEAKKSISEIVHDVVSSAEILALRNTSHPSYEMQYSQIDINFNGWSRYARGGRHIVYCATPAQQEAAMKEVIKIREEDPDSEIKLIIGKQADTGTKHVQKLIKEKVGNSLKVILPVVESVDFHPYIAQVAQRVNEHIENEKFKLHYHHIN